jgi:hypothetical protein
MDRFCDSCGAAQPSLPSQALQPPQREGYPTAREVPASSYVFQQQPRAQPSPSTYVDLPVTRHRVVFSYLGSPTGLIATILAVVILVASSLPFSAVMTCPLFLPCGGPTYTALSLANIFPLLWVLPAGALIVILTPALSLWARIYGRTLRGLTYCLIGALSILAPVTYVAFHGVYTPTPGCGWFCGQTWNLYYPFYILVTAPSILIAIGIFEWIRWPSFLFRSYSPPPPKPPKPKRFVVPEVVSTTSPVQPGVVEGPSLALTLGGTVEPARPSTAQTSSLDKLIKLKELLDSGAITREEFEEQKRMILRSGEP